MGTSSRIYCWIKNRMKKLFISKNPKRFLISKVLVEENQYNKLVKLERESKIRKINPVNLFIILNLILNSER